MSSIDSLAYFKPIFQDIDSGCLNLIRVIRVQVWPFECVLPTPNVAHPRGSRSSASRYNLHLIECRGGLHMLLLTGPTAAGKNTVARALAARQERCAVVDFDLIRVMFVNPHCPPWMGEEGHAQAILGAELASRVALGFQGAGWKVVLLDVITNDVYPAYQKALASVPFTVVQILPTLAENQRRFDTRGPVLTQEEFVRVHERQRQFRYASRVIDNTRLAAEEVAAELEQYL